MENIMHYRGQFERRLEEQTFAFGHKKELFHEDNARLVTCVVAMTNLINYVINYPLINHWIPVATSCFQL